MTDKPTPTDAATPECLTCSDHGAVGNILTAEPCPDCTCLNAQPAPAPMSPANRLVAYSAATRLRELGFEWDATAEAWLQPAPSAQAADSVLEDAARYRWLREGNDAKHGAAWYVAVNLYGCEWDAAIDAAMNKGGAT